jgi:hypothetical protein
MSRVRKSTTPTVVSEFPNRVDVEGRREDEIGSPKRSISRVQVRSTLQWERLLDAEGLGRGGNA